MAISISCKELGVGCNNVSEGETEQLVMESLMRHMNTEHTDDWFEIEEIYQIAHEVIRKKVA
jgi:predicted small metal-binding protein